MGYYYTLSISPITATNNDACLAEIAATGPDIAKSMHVLQDEICFEPDDSFGVWRNIEDNIVPIISKHILPGKTCRIDWEGSDDERGGFIIGHGSSYGITYEPFAIMDDGSKVPLSKIVTSLEAQSELIGTKVCPMNASACSCQHCDTCYDDSLPETDPKPSLAIMVGGGLVQGVFSDNHAFFEGIDVLVYDYDTEGADEDEKFNIVYANGETKKAVGHIETVLEPAIDIKASIGGMP